MADKSFWSDKKDKVWLKNFWYYYRVHVLVGIVIVLVLTFTIRDCMLRVDPDISIDFIGQAYLTDESVNKIEQYFQPMIEDVDEKNGNAVNLVQHNVVDTEAQGTDMQMAMAIQQAIMLEMAVGESYVYMLDDSHFNVFKENEILYDLSEISDLPKGTYSIEIQNNQLFKELTGLDLTPPVHFCIRIVAPSVSEKDIPKATGHQKNAISIFNEFYKYQ